MNEIKLKNVSFVRTMLMLLIILNHACAFWSGDWFTSNPIYASAGLGLLHSWLATFHVYAFTLVSGYVFAFKVIGGGVS